MWRVLQWNVDRPAIFWVNQSIFGEWLFRSEKCYSATATATVFGLCVRDMYSGDLMYSEHLNSEILIVHFWWHLVQTSAFIVGVKRIVIVININVTM